MGATIIERRYIGFVATDNSSRLAIIYNCLNIDIVSFYFFFSITTDIPGRKDGILLTGIAFT